MNALLDPEIQAVLEQTGLRARSFVRVSNIRSPEIDRIAYRIDHDQGTVKARRLENESIARRVSEMRRNRHDAVEDDFGGTARAISRHQASRLDALRTPRDDRQSI